MFTSLPNDRSQLTLIRGCVTPNVIANMKEESGMDPDLIDGYEDLPEEDQKRLMKALEQGHVDDEDWKGVCSY